MNRDQTVPCAGLRIVSLLVRSVVFNVFFDDFKRDVDIWESLTEVPGLSECEFAIRGLK